MNNEIKSDTGYILKLPDTVRISKYPSRSWHHVDPTEYFYINGENGKICIQVKHSYDYVSDITLRKLHSTIYDSEWVDARDKLPAMQQLRSVSGLILELPVGLEIVFTGMGFYLRCTQIGEERLDKYDYNPTRIPDDEIVRMHNTIRGSNLINEQMPVELKPCPFCGSDVTLGWYEHDIGHWIECQSCEYTIGYDNDDLNTREHKFKSPQDAANFWNRRV